MKKRILSNLTRIICVLFAIWTIITLFIVYKNIENPLAIKFTFSYLFFTFVFIIYIGLVTILKIRKLKWIEVRKRLLRFITIFIVFWVLNIVFTYLIKGQVNILDHWSIPFGSAFGITFADFLITQKNRNINNN